ncbi:hypothetical protein RND71_027804 [Anisodus tanguticus]|uniref:Uncharacterized protein n=1 Tax=Anisodus tanguticus TaxID=243964 RepID=A0AAE1V6I5_9SOLA|nr:hypothetical protein RND71_027804 [Anisodus tanguticus]
MDENLSRMRRRLDNMQNSLADKCETEEVAEPEISSALDDDNSNSEVHPEMLEPPIDVEKENLENASNYLSLGPSGPLLIPIETVDADDFATDAKDGAATGSKGGEHHLFDEFPQRNELVSYSRHSYTASWMYIPISWMELRRNLGSMYNLFSIALFHLLITLCKTQLAL